MVESQISGVIRHLRSAVLRDGAGLTDGHLLEDFIDRREGAALAALVRRHGPMVWGVCRRVLGDHHDAEDAFQATFLVRRAASVVPREMVGNWLYGVAHQTALKARATAAKRKGRERQVAEMPEPAVAEQDLWNDVRPLLDEELSRLPDKYRSAIVLCDLEGKTRKEAARQLGVPEGTLAARVARGRVMLAKRLTQRGVVLSAGALATVLSQHVASAGVPATVVSSTIKGASLYAAGQAAAGVISAEAAALTEGVLNAMLTSNLRGVTTFLLVLSLPLFGGGVWMANSAVTQQAAPPSQARGKEPSRPLVPPASEKDEGARPPHLPVAPQVRLPPAVRVNQSVNLTDLAAFYERTGHPGTAAFYRQLAAAREKRFRGAGEELSFNSDAGVTGSVVVKDERLPLMPAAPRTPLPPRLPPAVEKVEQGGNLMGMAAFYERNGHPKTAAFYRQLAAQKGGEAIEGISPPLPPAAPKRTRGEVEKQRQEIEVEIDKLSGTFENADVDVFVEGDTQKPFIKGAKFSSIVEISGKRYLEFDTRASGTRQGERHLIDPARIAGLKLTP